MGDRAANDCFFIVLKLLNFQLHADSRPLKSWRNSTIDAADNRLISTMAFKALSLI